LKEVTQEDNGKKVAFYVEFDGKRDALMTYTWVGNDKIIIDYTELMIACKDKELVIN
jgi:hypothetical protein